MERLALEHGAVDDPSVLVLDGHLPVEVLECLGELLVPHDDRHVPVAVHIAGLLVVLDSLPLLLLLVHLPDTNIWEINIFSKLTFPRPWPGLVCSSRLLR